MALTERGASRRNIVLISTDNVSFWIGMAFLGPTTVLPNLIRLLGGSPLAVGVLGAINSGAWMLPQFLAGRFIANRPLVQRRVIVPAYASRLCLALAAVSLLLLAPRAPSLAVAAILLGFLGFTVGDALSGIGWVELMSKVVPLPMRGRVLGAGQSLSSFFSIGAGVLVEAILARPQPFAQNHALLLGLASAFTLIGTTGIALIREPRAPVESGPILPWGEYLRRLGMILRHDQRFARFMAVRCLAGLADMAAAFYVLFAVSRLHIREDAVGLFISAGVVGGLLCGVLLGTLGDRRGAGAVVRVVMILRCTCPALALLAPLAAGWGPLPLLGLFLLIFALAGMVNGAFMVGFTNYLLEIAPASERSLYIALANTLLGLLIAAPVLAGWLVQAAGYEPLFALSLGVAVLGAALAWLGLEARPAHAG